MTHDPQAVDAIMGTPVGISLFVTCLTDTVAPQTGQAVVRGPSATADIELSRVEGVHGLRRLERILVTENRLRLR